MPLRIRDEFGRTLDVEKSAFESKGVVFFRFGYPADGQHDGVYLDRQAAATLVQQLSVLLGLGTPTTRCATTGEID